MGIFAQNRLLASGNTLRIREEFLVNPHSLEFNSEIDKALYPYRKVLEQLIDSPNKVDDALQPLVIHWTGGLTLNDPAQINSYFFCRILKISKERPLDWATGLAISHARTLVIAYRHRELFLQDEECPSVTESESLSRFIIEKAWERLVDFTGHTTDGKIKPKVVDVDMEALVLLERRMFDTSEDAGIAEEEKETREGNELELEVGPDFDKEKLAKWHRTQLEKEEAREQVQRATRPRPTLLRRGTRKRRTVSKIPAESVELKSTDDSEEYQSPAKRVCHKMRDDDSNS
ncbi:hypothetical protein EV421DRAFT_1744180 [Armillaria borealis]|uniref:Uncharacterized protein n=1 Tax=Armillaria borealis TaxID=47425 RepID=A0AA39MDL2_9AGAR|nr:hypothetical protein EV421DRAFT_1744180 [Armillaria borealis]